MQKYWLFLVIYGSAKKRETKMFYKKEASNESTRGKKNVQGFGGNAAARDWSLERVCDKHNLIYARYAFSNDFAKFWRQDRHH